jgi:replication factor C subunit 1
LIFDEVDGMAGNEDRGGVSEIIKLINNTKIPIICIANEVPRKLLSLKGTRSSLRVQSDPHGMMAA